MKPVTTPSIPSRNRRLNAADCGIFQSRTMKNLKYPPLMTYLSSYLRHGTSPIGYSGLGNIAALAQSVERLTRNEQVKSSILLGGSQLTRGNAIA